MNNRDVVEDFDGNRTGHGRFGPMFHSTDKAAMNGKGIAAHGHGNDELSVTLTVVFEIIEPGTVQ